MRSLQGFLFALLIAITSPWALAVNVSSIYEAKMPVPTESEEDKLQAEQDGLALVFMKVSGDAHILDNNPNLKSSLARADSLIEEYSYSTPDDAPDETPHLLSLRFDSEAVVRILRDAGSPVWSDERPLVLVWLSLQTPDHPADIVDASTGDIAAQLKQTAKNRGVPMIFPMMDVTDLATISVDDIGAKSVAKVVEASKRYDSNAILMGKVTQGAKDFSSHWILLLGNDRFSWDVTGNTLPDILSGIVDNVTDTLANRFGVTVSTAVQTQVKLNVQGITDNAGLIRLMKYLQHVPPVTDVMLDDVSDQTVTLTVGLHDSKDAFVQALASNKTLLPQVAANPADGVLNYSVTH